MQLGMTENGIGIRLQNMPLQNSTEYDVVIVGLGTAGAACYCHCVKEGLNVLGIEKTNGMGGQSTVGCVAFGASPSARILDFERRGRGGDIMYESVVIGVFINGNKVTGVRILSNGVIRDAMAKIVIDASGNASIARMCGLPLRKGRDYDGVMAPCARAETWMNLETKNVHPWYRNYPEDLTLSMKDYASTVSMLSRERHKHWLGNRKKERLLKPAMLVGAREEARVVTEQVLTLQEILERRTYPDPIFYAWGPEDLPVVHGDHAFESEPIQNWKVLCGLPFFGYPAVLTYGTIVAKGIDGLLVPSKHFGVAHDLGGGIRMQEDMRKTGIAAACAALVAIRRNCALKDVPYAELKPLLEAAGNLKPPRKNDVTAVRGYEFHAFSDEEAVNALKQDVIRTGEWWYAETKGAPCEHAAYAYWTAWRRQLIGNENERKHLADMLAAEMQKGGRFAGNFAVALGLMKDRRAVPILLEIVKHPGGELDPVIKNAYPNRVKALLLLGRFQEQESLPLMMDIIRDDAKSFMADLFGTGAFSTPDMCCFQALSYALMAIKSILAVYPNARIENELHQWQQRDFKFLGMDGRDITNRLKRH